MASVTLKVVGLDNLNAALKENATLDDVRRVVSQNGVGLNQKMVSKANFTKGYSTGATKRSIHLEITGGGLSAEVGPETGYSIYVEFGTRKMEAQPFVRPALEAQAPKFISDMQSLVR
jgi:HK97 gp10 family phage protein